MCCHPEMLFSVWRLQILWWSQHRNRITTWDYLGSPSTEILFFHPPLQLFSKKCAEPNNNHSGHCQDICIARRSSEKVCWTCFIMHTMPAMNLHLPWHQGRRDLYSKPFCGKSPAKTLLWQHRSGKLARQCHICVLQVKLQLAKIGICKTLFMLCIYLLFFLPLWSYRYGWLRVANFAITDIACVILSEILLKSHSVFDNSQN